MNDEQLHIELIEKHLSGKLSSEEMALFKDKLSDDQSFKEAYEEHIEAIAALKTYQFKEELSSFRQEFEKDNTGLSKTWKYSMGIAATIILIVSSVFLLQDEDYTEQALFDRYFEPYQNLDLVRGEEDPLSEALIYYSEEKYEKAIVIFQDLIHQSNQKDKIRLYLGVSFLGLKDYQRAVETLENVKEQSIYSEQVHWFLALSYLALDDRESATDYLMRISSYEYNYQQAKEILKML